jgi:hypothetical protein
MSTTVHENVPIMHEATIGFIVGKGGSTIKLIGQRTGASCSLRKAQPEAGRPHPWVWIKGIPENVQAAKEWIQTIIDEADTRAGREATSGVNVGGYTRNVYRNQGHATHPQAPPAFDHRIAQTMFPQFGGYPFGMLPNGYPVDPRMMAPLGYQPGVQVGFQSPVSTHSIELSSGQQVPYTMGPGEHMHFQTGPTVPEHQLLHAEKLPRPYTTQNGSPPVKPRRKLKFPVNKGETVVDVRRQDEYLADTTGTLNYDQTEDHQAFAEQVVCELKASGSTDVAINDELASPTYSPSSPTYSP